MAAVVHVAQFQIKMQIFFSRGDRRMSEEFLKRAHVHAAPQHVRRQRMTEHMREQAFFGYVRHPAALLDDLPQIDAA